VTSSGIEFPSDLEVLITREFDAPVELVFDVFTKEEHARNTCAPFGEEVTVCSIDLRVGGSYHYVFVTEDGKEMSFRGTYLELEPPTRTVQTWTFDGWPDAEAIETMELQATDGGTRMAWRIAFRDEAGRAHMTRYDGIESGFDNVARYLRSLVSH
jgi:uncharacterized protein YndB with AHSA1/START domain